MTWYSSCEAEEKVIPHKGKCAGQLLNLHSRDPPFHLDRCQYTRLERHSRQSADLCSMQQDACRRRCQGSHGTLAEVDVTA